MCKCPYCGKDIKLQKATWTAQAKPFSMVGDSAANLKVVPQPDYSIAQPAPTAVVPGARFETPVAQQNLESNVKVPLAQALVTGGIVGSAAFCIAASIVTGVEIFFDLPKPALFVVAPTVIATLQAVYSQWTGGVNMADSLLTKVEDFTGVDWNRDGHVGSTPAPQIERGLMVYGVDGQGRLLLPGLPRHQVLQMARRAAARFLAGRLPDNVRYNFSQDYLGQPFMPYLNDAKAVLHELGFIEPVGNNTYKLNDLGADWLAKILEQET